MLKKKGVNDKLMFFTAIAGGFVGLILTYAILFLIAVLSGDLSLMESNKWYFLAWIPSELLLILSIVITGNAIIAALLVIHVGVFTR